MVRGADENGWNEWSKHVLKELERLNGCYLALDKKTTDLLIEITQLKVKSGLWGFCGSAMAILLAYFLTRI
jgi:hypothetical protein